MEFVEMTRFLQFEANVIEFVLEINIQVAILDARKINQRLGNELK